MTVVLQVAACLGLGAACLKCLRILGDLGSYERFAWSFALGVGVLGWALFFFGLKGWLGVSQLTVFLCASVSGCLILLHAPTRPQKPLATVDRFLLAVLAVVLGADLVEGLAPPADGDSLAYHFAIPKYFLTMEGVSFVARAVDGAVPLLTQMTYLPALALGGERALTLWTMASGWGMAALIFVVARRFLNFRYALITTLIYLTTPAILYGAGTGQVEVRNGIFALLAAFSVAQGRKSQNLNYFLLAGLSAGFCAGTKYLGLLLVAAVGLTCLLDGRRIAQGSIFAIGVLATGTQWYWWNWYNTGDPVFPILSGLGLFESRLWPEGFYAWFASGFFGQESAVPANLIWLFLYPIKATFDGYPIFESSRTGLGPYVLLVLPFALIEAWRRRKSLPVSAVATMLVVVVLYYVLWFFTGSSQRIRHLVPAYPILLIVITISAYRFAYRKGYEWLLASAIAITLVIQISGQGIFSVNYVKRIVTSESRDAFLGRNVQGYTAVRWINENLTSEDKIFTLERQVLYLFDVPAYGGHVYNDATVDLRPSATAKDIFSQLYALGVTHILFPETQHAFNGGGPCFEIIQKFENMSIGSRALSITNVSAPLLLGRLMPVCTLNQ